MEFPKAEEFTVEPAKTCIKWRDLPIGVYRIIEKLSTRSKFGNGMRLELENITNEKTIQLSIDVETYYDIYVTYI